MTAHSGIVLNFRDDQVRPQDDLFRHLNGGWLRDYEIPADRAVDGAFRTLYDRAELHVRAIIEESAARATGDSAANASTPDDSTSDDSAADAQRIGDLYASFMDTATIATLGATPIADELSAIAAADSHDALASVLGELSRTGVGGLVGLYIDTDSKNSSRYLVHATQSGIGLPDEAYYREDAHAETRTKYVEYIAAMFELANLDYDADSVLALETAIAAGHWDVVKRRDADLTYNLTTVNQIADDNPGFPWRLWLEALTDGPTEFTEVVVRQPSFLTNAARLWTETDLQTWKAWTGLRLLNARASLLTDDFVELNFDFYQRTLSGTQEQRERWKRGVSMVESVFGEAVGKLYVAQHFPPESKVAMEELVANLLEAYRRSIRSLPWMGEQTRAAALTKLDKFTPKIGYPNKWRDYSGVEILPDDLVGNVRRAAAAEHDRELAKLGKPVDRDEWFMTPQTVNAYYNPGMNEIVFPAAILQPPFFDINADPAANYGGIGAVIGHEIGHGFDDQGAKYDGDGNLVDWWSDEDREEFSKRSKALIAQYNGFEPADLPGKKVNGELTIGENIGDLGGLSIALAAYEIALDGQPSPVIDGFTGIQRIYLSWAQVWRTKARDAEAIRRLATDPHSPPEFRCNGVASNIDSFYSAFDVSPGDRMYLAPEQRVQIW